MIFYDYWRSSSAWRVRIALHLKGVSFERRTINLIAEGGGEQHADDFRELNPMSQVPVLIIPGAPPRVLAQSMAILGYLDELFPAPPLLPPAGSWQRARARQLAEMVNSGIQPFQNSSFQKRMRDLSIDPAPISSDYNAVGLTALERVAGETAGSFLVGEAPTIADIYLIPQLYAARRFGVDLTPYPRLLRAEASAAALPAFQAARPERQTDAVPVTS